jgi:hypothetical protein
MNKLTLAAGLAAIALAASPAKAGEVYGPAEPKPFVYPDRFTVEAHETVEQAQAKVEAKRRCARNWMIAGVVGGTALDIVTTQINQRDGYREINPIYGKRASVGEMLLFRGAVGAWSYWRITRDAKRNPDRACKAAKLSAGVAFLPGVLNAAVRIRF